MEDKYKLEGISKEIKEQLDAVLHLIEEYKKTPAYKEDIEKVKREARKELLLELEKRASVQNFLEPVDNDNIDTWIEKKLKENS